MQTSGCASAQHADANTASSAAPSSATPAALSTLLRPGPRQARALGTSRPAHRRCGADSSGSSRSGCEPARVRAPGCVPHTCGACARCRCQRQQARRSLAQLTGSLAGRGAPRRAGACRASSAAAGDPGQHPAPALQACRSRGVGRRRPALWRAPACRRGPRPGRPRAARAATLPRALRRRRPGSRRPRPAAARRAGPQRSPRARRAARAQAALPQGGAPLRYAGARGAMNQSAARGAPKACCNGFTGHA